MDAVGSFVDNRTELAQDLQVKIDGASPNVASSQLWDERFTHAVQQRAAKQDRDA